jgi:hypothetical protein
MNRSNNRCISTQAKPESPLNDKTAASDARRSNERDIDAEFVPLSRRSYQPIRVRDQHQTAKFSAAREISRRSWYRRLYLGKSRLQGGFFSVVK